MSTTVLTKIKASHQIVLEKFKAMEVSHEEEIKKQIYLELREEILTQMQCEEKTIYQRMVEDIGDEVVEELTYQAEFEHEKLRGLISKLDNTSINNSLWTERLQKLRELFESHVRTEEKWMFKEAIGDFTPQELKAMGEDYESNRQHLDTSLL